MFMDKCVSPPELTDRELLGYLDGERSNDVVTHLEECSYCSGRCKQLAQIQNGITSHLYRLTCPPSEELGDYVLGLLPRSQVAKILVHLSDCPPCNREVAQLKDYLGELLPAPKASPLEQVKVLVARMLNEMEPGRLLGGLTPAPAYISLRGDASRTITLQADGILIILEVQPEAAGRFTVLGQIAAEEQDCWADAKADASRSGELLAEASVDDLGAFRFDRILPGVVELRIVPISGPVVLANIDIVE